jgi:hypothetical protein
MPEERGERLALSMGRREFEDLTSAWASYLQASRSIEPVDPIFAMQRTGSVLRALEHLLDTLESGPKTQSQ